VATLFICALGATNHTFMVVYAAAFVLAVAMRVAARANRLGVAGALRNLGLFWQGDRGTARGLMPTVAASGIAVDDQGSIYAADVGPNNLRKYVKVQ
jgi:hypothetical protein